MKKKEKVHMKKRLLCYYSIGRDSICNSHGSKPGLIIHYHMPLFNMNMNPYVRLLEGPSVGHIFLMGGNLHFYAPIGAFVVPDSYCIYCSLTSIPLTRTCPTSRPSLTSGVWRTRCCLSRLFR